MKGTPSKNGKSEPFETIKTLTIQKKKTSYQHIYSNLLVNKKFNDFSNEVFHRKSQFNFSNDVFIPHGLNTAYRKIITGHDYYDPSLSIEGQNFYKLFHGTKVLSGLTYNLLKRVHRFGSQEIIKDNLSYYLGDYFRQIFGAHYSSVAVAFSASMLVGIIEAPTNLPIDITSNYISLNKVHRINKSLNHVFYVEMTKFNGTLKWNTMANMVGSVSLFTVQAYLKSIVINADNSQDTRLPLVQRLGITTASAFFSVSCSYPLHSIKDKVAAKLNPKEVLTFAYGALKQEGVRKISRSLFSKTIAVSASMLLVEESVEAVKHYFFE